MEHAADDDGKEAVYTQAVFLVVLVFAMSRGWLQIVDRGSEVNVWAKPGRMLRSRTNNGDSQRLPEPRRKRKNSGKEINKGKQEKKGTWERWNKAKGSGKCKTRSDIVLRLRVGS
jgi:hypothetical protein